MSCIIVTLHVPVYCVTNNASIRLYKPRMEQTKDLFCMCDSGVARCQSQNQHHYWQMNSLFEVYCMGKSAWQLSIKLMSSMRQWTVAKILRFIKGLL